LKGNGWTICKASNDSLRNIWINKWRFELSNGFVMNGDTYTKEFGENFKDAKQF
jgi:hypothetical protein